MRYQNHFFNTTDSKFINNLLQLNQENKKAVNDELASLHTGEVRGNLVLLARTDR